MDKEYPIIITYFTSDWLYESYANEMREACKALGLDYHIVEKESAGGYANNCKIKPHFILESLIEYKRPVLWIDADGALLKKPEFFCDLSLDFAAKTKKDKNRGRWHVGTIWCNYTNSTISFLKKWVESSKSSVTDESALESTWKLYGDSIKAGDIPEQYFFIHRRKSDMIPEDTVVLHRLSSGKDKLRLKYKKTPPFS